MNILSFDKQVTIVAALSEGCSIRAVERLTDTHRDTVMRLGVRVGQGCAGLHDRMMRDLHVNLHAPNQCLQQKVGEPQGSGRAVRRPLQSVPGSRDVADHARHGARRHGSYLDDRRAGRGRPWPGARTASFPDSAASSGAPAALC